MNKTLVSRYKHIKERCYNPNSKAYKRYGARGIKMCEEWLNDYMAFENWAFSNGFQEGLAIDRIDNDGNYEPNNCRFVTLKENNQKRCTSRYYTIGERTMNLQQWCDEYKMVRGTVHDRLKKGWSIIDALTKPVKQNKRDKCELLGKRFGRLSVIAYAGDEYIKKDNNSRWVCQCDCGTVTIVGSNQTSDHTGGNENETYTEEHKRRITEI